MSDRYIWKTNHPATGMPPCGRWLKEKGEPLVFKWSATAKQTANDVGHGSLQWSYEVRPYVPTPHGKWQLRHRGVYSSRELAQAALRDVTFLHDVEIELVEET
jgi:hypothetical protein